MHRSGTGRRATRKPVVVLAGEDANDRSCLRLVLEADCPAMTGRIVEINDAVRLHSASQVTLAQRVDLLARKARARAEREQAPLACVIVHEDWDGVDGDGPESAQHRVNRALASAVGSAHYVLATWEIEAWLLLFPDALRAESSTWVVPRKYAGRDTGALTDPKRILRTECSGRGRRYSVADAPSVFEHAVRLGALDSPAGTNRSWERFRGDAQVCCAEHLTNGRSRGTLK